MLSGSAQLQAPRRARRWRDSLLASASFQRWVARVPLLRAVGRYHAGALFGLCAGFVQSQVLYSVVRLGWLEALRDGPLPCSELQQLGGLDAASARLLIEAADALRLTEPCSRDSRALGLMGAALLGNAAVLRMIEHQPLFYADLQDPLALLRGAVPKGGLASYWSYARSDRAASLPTGAVADYSGLMAATQPLVAGELLAAYPFARHRVMLDVGGGDGTLLCAVGARAPGLRLMLFDLPAVAVLARQRLREAGLAARSEVCCGDFRSDALPVGADLISLVRVAHDHEDDTLLPLLKAARRALPDGGRLLIAEPMRGVAGSFPAADIYLGFYLRAMGQGRVRTPAELTALLEAAGFSRCRMHPTLRPWQCAVISATADGVSIS